MKTMNKVARLPENVINQIAAGEVVENPASIVKELVENSLDAGARRIAVEIKGGGLQLVRVEDDGCGMEKEDALLALERHATSKIRSIDDLETLGTMGFRGEALAAIAAVSHFELKTSAGGEATRIAVDGGLVSAVEICARNQGATVEVRSLFYNVPARKKFQKSTGSCTAAVVKAVETIALAHPEIYLSLLCDGKSVVDARPAGPKERVEEIAGRQDREVFFEKDGFVVRGFLSAPEKAGQTRLGQHLYINRRPIFSPLISKAVKQGFGTRIEEKSHPAFVLFLEIPPSCVDVNVHPQKKEARFREEAKIFRLFEEAVGSAFGGMPEFAAPFTFSPLPEFSLAEEIPLMELQFSAPSLPLSFPERILGLAGRYLLLQKERWILVDLRAAQARVLFEAMQEKKETPQALIWPLEIELSREEAAEGERIAEDLKEMGIEARFLGPRTLAVDALPSVLGAADFPLFFAAWKEGKKLPASIARFARTAKRDFTLEQASLIWSRLKACKEPLYDPSGKKTFRELAEADLEKLLA